MKNLKSMFKEDFKISCSYLQKYNLIYLFVMAIVSVFEIVMIAIGFATFDFSSWRRIAYMVSYFVLLIACILTFALLMWDRKAKVNPSYLGIALYVYTGIIYLWSIAISWLDMINGHYPIVFITIAITVSSICFIEPAHTVFFDLFGIAFLLIENGMLGYNSIHTSGDYFNFFVIMVMAVIISFRQYVVLKREYNQRIELRKKSYTDTLTMLENGTAYFDARDELDEICKTGHAKFILLLVDMNGLKVTNDLIGHKYGSYILSLIGSELPNIFKTSRCFRIGGDEFAVMVFDEDYDNFNELLAEFDEKLSFRRIEYEGQELIVSFARGYAKCGDKDTFGAVFERADAAMYKNKSIIKMTHDFTLKPRNNE